MKHLILILLPIWAFGQTVPAKDALFIFTSSGTDTLVASDTIIFEFTDAKGKSLDFTGRYEYSWVIKTDSISGANAGTIAVQIANDNDNSPVWFTTSTGTIDGPGTQLFSAEGTLRARRHRILITSPSGTRKTVVNAYGAAKRLAGPGNIGL